MRLNYLCLEEDELSCHLYRVLVINHDHVCAGRISNSLWPNDRFDHHD